MEPNAVVVNCEVAGTFRGAPYLPMKNAVTVSSLKMRPYSISIEKIRHKWPHLNKVKARDLKNVVPELIIGINNLRLILHRELALGPPDAPIGWRTPLGWTVGGNFDDLMETQGCVNYTVSEPNFGVIPRTRWQGMNQVEGRAYDILQKTTKRTGASIHVKNENVMQHEHELAHTIVNDFYVDDCLTGADSEEKCMDLRRELSEVNAAGGFHLCKFNSNFRAVIESIPEELRAKGVKSLNEKSVIPAGNVLGMWWDPMKDIFGFKFGLNKVPQRSWKERYLQNVRHAVSKLKEIHLVQVPRCYHPDLLSRSIIRQVEVHTFVDASQEAFSAVTYLRVEAKNGNITTTLFGSKARVAPLKKRTIPKLELQGCVLGTRFASDSKTVLAWIRSEAGRYKEFVANRVGEIQEAIKGTDWRWVPTSENPADIATRFETEISFEPTDMW
ncbi:hypothetical protein LAZ67_9002145 [Cordylochernes scorpioides]|uniref:Reverse transcriptase n=1 Tax=Cordylochernes scorpioides TaxID=51811 RepID=A0ABY6KYK1_9ARAC|nr:hypothetical protein LAZ67_9002145 [Cordylochernes scorpioides]